MTIINFLILSLAVWRIASLFGKEEGPLDIFLRLRLRLGTQFDKNNEEVATNNFTKGLTCMWCSSVWWAVMIVVFYQLFPSICLIFCLPFALSAMAIAVERIHG